MASVQTDVHKDKIFMARHLDVVMASTYIAQGVDASAFAWCRRLAHVNGDGTETAAMTCCIVFRGSAVGGWPSSVDASALVGADGSHTSMVTVETAAMTYCIVFGGAASDDMPHSLDILWLRPPITPPLSGGEEIVLVAG